HAAVRPARAATPLAVARRRKDAANRVLLAELSLSTACWCPVPKTNFVIPGPPKAEPGIHFALHTLQGSGWMTRFAVESRA
ncbi:MAG TPA: hypothetical protein VLB69_00330, partial [Rudaea sp.]|nr:hypothetical protein [Rudaea sp.]